MRASAGSGASRWGSADGRRPSHQLDLDELLREPAARDRLAGELREHGLRALVRECRRQSAAPAPADRRAPRRARARRHRARPRAGGRPRRHDERVPGQPRRRRDAACSRRGRSRPTTRRCGSGSSSIAWRPFWRELCGVGRAAPRPACASASSCTRARSAYSSGVVPAPGRARRARTWASTSTRATSGGRGSTRCASSRTSATAIGFAHGKDTLDPRRPRPPRRRDRLPLPGRPGRGHVALRGRRHRPHGRALGRAPRRPARRPGTTATSRSSTRTRA